MDNQQEIKFYEIEFKDGYSMAIKGIRQPTVKEAQDFYDRTIGLNKTGLARTDATTVVNVLDITEDETKHFFDTRNIDNWEVFGIFGQN